ncbi:MAG TPA: hypothetical protein VFB60_00095 [Ktedonobacteraceae bacterium]|nr:hypothetical protein [Ktedonobacteraceae bacterium]
MANALKDTIQEKIEIVDQPDDLVEPKQKKFRFLIPVVALALAAVGTFIWVRRLSAKNELN